MDIISNEQILALNISPETCVKWAHEALMLKYESVMPAKAHIHIPGQFDFFTSMPCLLPKEYGLFGCKVASRFSNSHPSVKSHLMLCDSTNGNFLSLIDCEWITSMRTGATAALAILTYRKSDAHVYSFMGLGNAGTSALRCFLGATKSEQKVVRLLRYKDHAERAIERFSAQYPETRFEIADDMTALVNGADVVTSCITVAPNLLVEDTSLFKPGVLLVPVHTRGFQNCDTVFEKIFGDDTAQISVFQYFNQFRSFHEFSEVLLGRVEGRANDSERIIAYNIGLGLLDVYFAGKISQLIKNQSITPPHLP